MILEKKIQTEGASYWQLIDSEKPEVIELGLNDLGEYPDAKIEYRFLVFDVNYRDYPPLSALD